jgi:hypothetical protein
MILTKKLSSLTQSGIAHYVIPIAMVAVVAIVGGYVLLNNGQAATLTGAVYLESGVSGKCLDDAYDKSANGTKIQSYACNKSTAQQWELNSNGTIENPNGKCLDNDYGKIANDNPITLYTCSGTNPAEQWTNTATILKNPTANKCIDIPYASSLNGTALQLYTCNGKKQQTWTAVKVSGSTGTGSTTTGSGTTGTSSGGSGAVTSNTPVTPTSTYDCQYTPHSTANVNGYTVDTTSSKDGNPASFDVKLNADSTNKNVIGFPADQCLLYSPTMPANLSSSYKITPPTSSTGLDYEYAYDIWINTPANLKSSDMWTGQTEIMYWVYNNGQTPATGTGGPTKTLADGSKLWICDTTCDGYSEPIISIVAPSNSTSGTVNIQNLVSEVHSLGYDTPETGIIDVEFGIEGPYGGGQTFAVNSFSLEQ